MADPVRITIVTNTPTTAKLTAESGYKLLGSTTGSSIETDTSFGKVKTENVSGRDLVSIFGFDISTSWPDTSPSNNAYSITFPSGSPLYMGWDTDRGLVIGTRFERGQAGAYTDFGIAIGPSPFTPSQWSDADTYVTYSDGRTVLTNSLRGNTAIVYDEQTGKAKYSYQPYRDPLKTSLGGAWAHCFLKGTGILLSDQMRIDIADVKIGDLVACYPQHFPIKSALELRSVVKVFQNITNTVVNLRGTYCTPGHMFLTDDASIYHDGHFATLADILRNDRTLVEHDGTVLRARTGAKIGEKSDTPVAVVYYDQAVTAVPSVERHALVRAGILMPATTLGNGAVSAPARTLAQHLEAHGITILQDGSLRTPDGTLHAACNWPEGSTPFDTHEACNWIVEADGKSYTPPWIRDLVEEDETQGLRVVGAMPTVAGTTSANLAPL